MVVSKLKQMLADDGAVSPVIGVILMVAVTVVLAAVISVFVFGIGDSLGEPAPNAQIDFDYNSETDNLAIIHDGGDSITQENTGLLTVTGDVTAPDTDAASTWGDNFDQNAGDSDTLVASPDGPTTSGDYIFDTSRDESADGAADGAAYGSVGSEAVVELQWQSNGGDQSTTLGTFEAP